MLLPKRESILSFRGRVEGEVELAPPSQRPLRLPLAPPRPKGDDASPPQPAREDPRSFKENEEPPPMVGPAIDDEPEIKSPPMPDDFGDAGAVVF